jgi:hypothetical protein
MMPASYFNCHWRKAVVKRLIVGDDRKTIYLGEQGYIENPIPIEKVALQNHLASE